MHLDNVGIDAVNPRLLGRFWQAALGGRDLTDTDELFETRLSITGGPTIDLCFARVPAPPAEPVRVHLDLYGGAERDTWAQQLRDLGATDLDVGQGDVPWVVLADPEGNPFCVMPDRPGYTDRTGPIAAIPIDCADPARDAAFWAELTGWTPLAANPTVLRHPSRRGPQLRFCDELSVKPQAKNRMHLDVRLDPSDDPADVRRRLADLGASELNHDWGELPWTVYTDPSGNEFCVLPVAGN